MTHIRASEFRSLVDKFVSKGAIHRPAFTNLAEEASRQERNNQRRRERRKKLREQGLTADGLPRLAAPRKKKDRNGLSLDRAAYMRIWRQERAKLSQGVAA